VLRRREEPRPAGGSGRRDLSRKKGGCADVRDQVGREAAEHKGAFQRAIKRCEE